MEREEFNKLTVNEQVTEFNKLYKEHKSIKKVASDLGISKNTISSRFTNAGYTIFEGVGYVSNTNTPIYNKTSITEPPSEDKREANREKLKQLVNSMVEEKFNELVNKQPVNIDIELSSLCDGNIKYRSWGYYENIGEKFIEYCKNKKRYTQIEILSQAMLEFMQNHK
jgi:DNA-binding transcriptional regulator YhcF (GntR family)